LYYCTEDIFQSTINSTRHDTMFLYEESKLQDKSPTVMHSFTNKLIIGIRANVCVLCNMPSHASRVPTLPDICCDRSHRSHHSHHRRNTILVIYCVFTSESASTSMCSFVERVWVESSGNSALQIISILAVVLRNHLTYVKPLMSLNSFVILPPCFLTSDLALSSWSAEAPSLSVTC